MIFGQAVAAAPSPEPAAWIAPACNGRPGTVGSLVPAGHEGIIRVEANEPSESWWTGYRALHVDLAEIAVQHTSTPDRAWFAIWEGHGFTSWTPSIAWSTPPSDDAEARRRSAELSRIRAEARAEHDRIAAELGEIPRFELPDRTHHLLTGPVAAVADLADPAGGGQQWHRPDLWWPDDRRWFVATDVDFWSLYVGGDAAMLDAVTDAVPSACHPVTPDEALVSEV